MRNHAWFILVLCAFSVSGVELKVGPSLGVILPSDIQNAPTHPGPGLYYGGVGEYRFGRILSAEISLGAALEFGDPLGTESPGLPEFDVLGTDFVCGGAAFVADLAAISFSAGIGYYHVYMEWYQNYTGFDPEWKSLTSDQLGYNAAVGINLPQDIDLRMTFHFPDMEHMWGVLSLNWKPLDI